MAMQLQLCTGLGRGVAECRQKFIRVGRV